MNRWKADGTKVIDTYRPTKAAEVVCRTYTAALNVATMLNQLERFVVATPPLFHALRSLVWQHDNVGELCGMTLQDARAALKKAEGV